MKKIIAAVASLLLPLLAHGAQQDVSQISGTMSSVGALKTQTNSKLLAIDANFDELYAYRPWVKQTTAPADTTVLWFDTDQVEGYVVLKVHNGTTWVAQAMGTAGATAINDLTDVDTTGKATGKILKFDASGNLVVADDATGTGSVPSGSVNGQVLIWATDQWVASTAPWLTTAALGTGVETALGNAANAASGPVVLNASAQLPGVSGINLIGSWTGTTLAGITAFGPAIQALGTEIDNMAQISTTVDGYVKVESGAVTVGALPAASDTVAGIIERATTAEDVTGAATDKATTPAGLTARLAAPGPIGATPDTGTFTTVTASAFESSAADGSRRSVIPNNTTISPLGDGSEEIYNEGGQLKVVEGNIEYDLIHSGDLSNTVIIQQSFVSSSTLVADTGAKNKLASGIDWTTADIGCDVSGTLNVSVKSATTVNGTYTEMGAISLSGADSSSNIDISSWANSTSGHWIRIDITGTPVDVKDCIIAIGGTSL